MQKGYTQLLIIICIVGLAIIAGIYYFNKNNTSVVQPTSQLTAADETLNWKTYTNTKYGYSVKYPDDFEVDELTGLTVIYKGEKFVPSPNSPLDPYGPLSFSNL